MKEAIVLAGGMGTRLQTVVNDRPKCMATVAGKPFLQFILDYLQKEEFKYIILSLGYKSEYVIEWMSTQSYLFDVSYVVEKEPLGTGGGIKYAATKSKSDAVFVLNGDTFFDVDTNALKDYHTCNQAEITLALKPMVDFDRYGSVDLDGMGRIISFNEKEYCPNGLINGGVYLMQKSIVANITSDKFSFEKELLESKINQLDIFGYIQDSYFIDIGIPTDYEKANIDFIDR